MPWVCDSCHVQDDAPVPVARYAHMSDIPAPELDPQTFDAWKAEMQKKLQQRLQQSQQQSTRTGITQAS